MDWGIGTVKPHFLRSNSLAASPFILAASRALSLSRWDRKNRQQHRLIDQLLSYQQGDPNVPEGKLTFEVDLTRPLSEDNPEPEKGQRSFLLSNVIEARFKDFPPTYRARYVVRFHVPGGSSLHLIYLLP